MQEKLQDIMRYESDIWNVADELRGASIKESDWPAYMMPFFALMMLEGCMRNAAKAVETEFGVTAAESPDDFREMFLTKDCGFNEFIVIGGKTLAKVCANDTSFEQVFKAYLHGFDPDLRDIRPPLPRSGDSRIIHAQHLTQKGHLPWRT